MLEIYTAVLAVSFILGVILIWTKPFVDKYKLQKQSYRTFIIIRCFHIISGAIFWSVIIKWLYSGDLTIGFI